MGDFIIPRPWISLQDTILLLGKPHTWFQIGISLARVIVGFSLAFIAGTVVGVFMGSKREFEVMFKPVILLIQGIPPILWAIPLILILGSSDLSPVLVISLICFPLVAMNVAEGMKSVPQTLEEMLKVFAPGMVPKIREVILPHLRPFFAASLKLGFVLGFKASVVGEYFGATDGIGFQIQVAYQSLQVRKLFSWGMLLVLLIILFDYLLSRIEKRSSTRETREHKKETLSYEREDLEELKNVFLAKRVSPAILLEDVSFKYVSSENILKGIDLTVNPEEVAVISGDSGTGKTTLLNIIASLRKPGLGRVASPENMGFIFQDDRFLPWRTNAWNVALPLIYQGYSKKNSLCFASYLLKEVGLTGEEFKYPGELSGGMKKRLAFARCFARLPGSILMDEPFTGLHKEARNLLWKKFFDLLNLHPVPVIIVTHFPEEVPVTSSCSFYTLSGNPARLIKN
jgi:NitT/TauT family transport system permease protein